MKCVFVFSGYDYLKLGLGFSVFGSLAMKNGAMRRESISRVCLFSVAI
jgi:hypothetical protein